MAQGKWLLWVSSKNQNLVYYLANPGGFQVEIEIFKRWEKTWRRLGSTTPEGCFEKNLPCTYYLSYEQRRAYKIWRLFNLSARHSESKRSVDNYPRTAGINKDCLWHYSRHTKKISADAISALLFTLSQQDWLSSHDIIHLYFNREDFLSLLFSLVACQKLKIHLYCWRNYTVWTHNLQDPTWIWPGSLLPEDEIS